MKKNIRLTFAFLALANLSSFAQLSTGAGGATSILPNSPTTNTNVGIGTNTPNAKLEIPALLNGQTFTDFNDGFKKSLLLNIGAYRDGYFRLLTFADMPSSNVKPNAETWFSIEDRNDANRLRHHAEANGASSFTINDKTQSNVFSVYEDGSNAFFDLTKTGSYLTVGGKAVWPVAHNFWVKTGSSCFEGNVFMNTNLGIGTSNFTDGANTYKLSVKGKIRAEEIKVYSTWADYVFADEYQLRPLSELEKFIKENKHLPNVPSAKEVTENGLALGEMVKVQQEKIEELTLYIIDQNKKLEELRMQVNALLNKK
ncbi:hypothetical protein NAT51_06440 [Flavobacterium amniphilum]|uniref:hypothetical protein n=1 Tax=Flavobacterium amniphilum TaxID=1834035 RepID=UPI00202A85EB|nr:hypothetical protein [Flavobacterium amniphilum]MCL9805149.1 hypothetical protein [Flavobacterium amniphilum]